MRPDAEYTGKPDGSEAGDDKSRLVEIVDEVMRQRKQGTNLTDAEVIANYPELHARLRTALATRARIHHELLSATRTAPATTNIEPLSESRLDEPLLPSETEHPARGKSPNTIQGYRIDREISRGGQASVFQAVQESTGRRVAIKVVAGGPYLTSQNRARFDREVKILAALNHPGVVRIVDSGRTEDGSFFFVMDYIEGENLDSFVLRKSKEWTSKDLARLFQAISFALEEAHHNRVIHRDLKPSNIIVDARGDPHLLDFGLARLSETASDTEPERWATRTGHVIGSMPWASPEQAIGDLKKLGPQTDVYSLGVMLYHSLTSSYPYPTVGNLSEVVRNICKLAPTPFEKKPDKPFGHVDAELAEIVLKALSKNAASRQPSAAALARELGDYITGRARGKHRRSRIRRDASYILVGVLGVGILGYAWSIRSSPFPVAVVELPHYSNAIGMAFVRVPAGQFWMGSAWNEDGRESNEQQHLVTITPSFYIQYTEVTRAQYRRVMGSLPTSISDNDDELPIDRVSWNDALEFCQRLSAIDHRPYRLPTEAEWEYACRANSTKAFAGTGRLDDMGWYANNSNTILHAVARKQPNHWGLYDMHGNVAEWCFDDYNPNLGKDPKTNPSLKMSSGGNAVYRGGAGSSYSYQCRSSYRAELSRAQGRPGLGFRVVIDDKVYATQPTPDDSRSRID